MDRQLAARRSLVLIFLCLAHSTAEQGPEMCAQDISSRTPFFYFYFFKMGNGKPEYMTARIQVTTKLIEQTVYKKK